MNIWNILEYTVVVSVVGLLILGMKQIFRDKLDARWHYFIWLVLLVRMIVPVDFNFVRTPLSVFQQVPVEKWFEKARIIVERHGLEGIPELMGKIYLWGAAVLAFFYLASWVVLWVKILRAPMADEETYAYVQEIARKYDLKSCERIRICQSNTPYIFGVFSPVLVLPENITCLQEEIIVHELLHMRCRDVLINLALHMVRVINWFNPFVWLLCSMVQNDSEALCDQRVLEHCGKERTVEYGEMLLCMTAGKRYNPVKIGTSNMASSFKNMKTRIERIRDFRRVPAGIGFVTLCITLMLTVASIGSSAEEYSTLKVPSVRSERDLERGLLEARCYHAPTPHQAIYLFLRSALERNVFYRMAVTPEEYVEGLENFAKVCYETDLIHDEDYGSVETWDPEAYSPYYPREMYELKHFTIYNLQYDKSNGKATVLVEFDDNDTGEVYAEWKLELVYEDGWKVWLAGESEKWNEKERGDYVPEALLYGCTTLGDFKVEILGFNEGEFSGLNQRNYAGVFSFRNTTSEETFPLFFSNEYKSERLYVTYTGEGEEPWKQVKIVSGEAKADVDREAEIVNLVADIQEMLDDIMTEAERQAEETGDKMILEDAEALVSEVMNKVASNEKLTREELKEIGRMLGISVEDAEATDESDREYIVWRAYTGHGGSVSGMSHHTYTIEELMKDRMRLLSGGGSGYGEPGHGWTGEDQIGAYVKIYISDVLVQEGYVWNQSH